MLEIPRSQLESDPNTAPPRIVVAGIGSAGVGLVDRLTMAGYAGSIEMIAMDSDSTVLGASVTARKILLGSRTARGLGTGGDPDLGAESADESEAEIDVAFEGAQIVVLCAGLGGGVGGGAGPAIAAIAKRRGALVFGICTLPFTFEGKRRAQQADEAARDFQKAADALIVFENDRMSEIAEPRAGVHETFEASDHVLAESLASLLRLSLSTGPLRVSTGDLFAIFGTGAPAYSFGHGQGEGGNRANEAVERALKTRLMNRGKSLADARNVLVQIEGSADLTLVEIQTIMQTVLRHASDGASLHLGIGMNPNCAATLGVSILAALGGSTPPVSRPRAEAQPIAVPVLPDDEQEPTPAGIAPETVPNGDGSRHGEELFNTGPYTVPKAPPAKRPARAKQETLSLDPVNRGRFDKSEPTIVGGEDLDVPTFIRQKIRLK